LQNITLDHGVPKTKWRKFMYNHATTANANITYIISDHHVERKILYKMKDWNLIQMKHLI